MKSYEAECTTHGTCKFRVMGEDREQVRKLIYKHIAYRHTGVGTFKWKKIKTVRASNG